MISSWVVGLADTLSRGNVKEHMRYCERHVYVVEEGCLRLVGIRAGCVHESVSNSRESSDETHAVYEVMEDMLSERSQHNDRHGMYGQALVAFRVYSTVIRLKSAS